MAINMTSPLNSVLPGLSKNLGQSSDIIGQLLSGNLTSGERRSIFNAGAERGVMSGMPGSTAVGGSLFANADLRNIGLASGQRQQQGIQDLLSLLQGVSGTVVPTAGQEIQDQQFGQDMDFRRTNADRDYGLRRDMFNFERSKARPNVGPQGTVRYTAANTGWPGSLSTLAQEDRLRTGYRI